MSQIVWEPTPDLLENSHMAHFMKWVNNREGLQLSDYRSLWEWSVNDLEAFWLSIWDCFRVQASQSFTVVLNKREMPDAEWFPGAHLNYAEHIFRNRQQEKPALLYKDEASPLKEMSWAELYDQTASVADYLKRIGVKPGDRVAGYLPNIPEAVIAFLACASIGAIWSCCAPDLGTSSVISRFKQIEPTVLFAVDSYQFNGKIFERSADLVEIQRALPSLKQTVFIPRLNSALKGNWKNSILWDELLKDSKELIFQQVSFSHPLWILYSSGTTGQPKGIVQGHGGILLEHLKNYYLHQNISNKDVFFWYSSTSWMVWNIGVSALLTGATLVIYDGSPNYPGPDALWRLAEMTKATFCGAGAGYIHYGIKAGVDPKKYDLSHLKSIGVTGAPLRKPAFDGYTTIFQRRPGWSIRAEARMFVPRL